MQIKSVTRLSSPLALVDNARCDYVFIRFHEGQDAPSLYWPYETGLKGPKSIAKRNGGRWDGHRSMWTFQDTASAYKTLEGIKKRHPDWPILDDPRHPFMPLARVEISRVKLGMGLEACLMPFPLHPLAEMPDNLETFLLESGSKNRQHDVGLLLGSCDAVANATDLMRNQGAVFSDRFIKKVPLCLASNVQVAVSDWAVQLQCDLTNPHHYYLAPEPDEWNQRFKNYAAPWDGIVHTTRKKWSTWKSRLLNHNIKWEGDDPAIETVAPIAVDASSVPGWDTPAPNGHLLHAYQKTGVQFCLARGMRAMLGDEMGIGKTAQAIAAAEAAGAQRVVIFCPANARYVWEREIEGWSARGAIQHIRSQFDKPDLNCRWHIVTYDLLPVRPLSWTFLDEQEARAFLKVYPRLSDQIKNGKDTNEKLRKISFDEPLDAVPAFADPVRKQLWQEGMQSLRKRLDDGVLAQLLSMDQVTVVADEAHRAKNQEAKRTKAMQQVAERVAHLLLLTGTPLRNNEHEAAVLLGLLDARAAKALSRHRGYTIEDVKDCLNHLMIRRTKAEVLPELPGKTRQRLDLDDLDREQLTAYQQALLNAKNAYDTAIQRGETDAEARHKMQGSIEQARTALGLAKVMSDSVMETILETIDNKRCCVVFTAHHKVSDLLKERLTRHKLKTAVIDGRVPPQQRAAIVDHLQRGEIDVVIGGIHAAGESITLTRADTAIFVELDWVPAALQQAEDRIHRVGQQSCCQIIQLIAKLPPELFNLDDMMVELLGAKLAVIGNVLDEDTSNVVAEGAKSVLQERLLNRWRSTATTNRHQDSTEPQRDENTQMVKAPSTEITHQTATKRKPGRPKKYSDAFPPPSAADRSKRSLQALSESGGRRVMLRLVGAASTALDEIMKLTGSQQATATINQAIIEWHLHLAKTSTKNPDNPL